MNEKHFFTFPFWRGTAVCKTASTANDPLPCIGTQIQFSLSTWATFSSSSRTYLVASLNSVSRDPKSRSMADLTEAEHVRGPGVNNFLSVKKQVGSPAKARARFLEIGLPLNWEAAVGFTKWGTVILSDLVCKGRLARLVWQDQIGKARLAR